MNLSSFYFHILAFNYYFCLQESHIHSLMNVLRYCNLDESLLEEESLVCFNALQRLYKTKELDYMSYIVLRMFENTEVGYFGLAQAMFLSCCCTSATFQSFTIISSWHFQYGVDSEGSTQWCDMLLIVILSLLVTWVGLYSCTIRYG